MFNLIGALSETSLKTAGCSYITDCVLLFVAETILMKTMITVFQRGNRISYLDTCENGKF